MKNNPFCDDYKPLVPDGTFKSSNYSLVGCANPKTYVPPIMALRSHDLDEWRATSLVVKSEINDSTNFDYYRSGYAPNPIPVNNVSTGASRVDVKDACAQPVSQIDRVTTQTLQPGVYQQSRLDEPIQSNIGITMAKPFDPMIILKDCAGNVTYKAVDGNHPLSTYCGASGGGNDGYRTGRDLNVTDAPSITVRYNLPDGNANAKADNLIDLFHLRPDENKITTNVASSNYGGNGGNGVTSLRRTELDIGDNCFVGSSAGRDFSLPPVDFNGLSVNPSWLHAKDKLVDVNYVNSKERRDMYSTLNKLLNKSRAYNQAPDMNQNRYNTFDPRFTGYGDNDRFYVDSVVGQPKFAYGDVDSITRPSLITRNDVDIYPWSLSADSDANVDDYRCMANDAFLNSQLKFRVELQERLMRKRNAEMWQRRVAPIYRNY